MAKPPRLPTACGRGPTYFIGVISAWIHLEFVHSDYKCLQIRNMIICDSKDWLDVIFLRQTWRTRWRVRRFSRRSQIASSASLRALLSHERIVDRVIAQIHQGGAVRSAARGIESIHASCNSLLTFAWIITLNQFSKTPVLYLIILNKIL